MGTLILTNKYLCVQYNFKSMIGVTQSFLQVRALVGVEPLQSAYDSEETKSYINVGLTLRTNLFAKVKDVYESTV